MIDAVLFYTQQYLDLYPFLVPLGVIGIWRWTTWLVKEGIALSYRPKTDQYKSEVSIVTPVYNEIPEVFWKALLSWKAEKPKEIIAVIDHTDKKNISLFKKFAKGFKNARLIVTKIPGKRAALATGIEKAKSKIVALVDADTFWTPGVIKNSLPPFSDPKMAGVATYQNVLEPKTLAQKIFDVQLDLRYRDEFPFLARAGDALVCLSGRTAFYKKSIIKPMLNDLVNERFMGKLVISGDDKCLTYLVLAAGFKVAYQSNALVYTHGLTDMSSYMKQRLRWTRNALRADLKALRQGWPKKHPALLFFQIDKVFQMFTTLLSPLFFLTSLVLGLYFPAMIVFVWWFGSRAIKLMPHLRRRPQDITLLPFYILYSFLTAGLRMYAFFTLNTQGWITRWDKSRLQQFTFFQQIPAYAATIIVFVVLIIGIILYKEYRVVIPQYEQRKLVSRVLPEKTNIITNEPVSPEMKDLLVKKYIVQPNDSLANIADKFGTTMETLLSANVSRINNWDILEPGLVLNIPGKDTTLTLATRFNYQRRYNDSRLITYDEASNMITVSGRGQSVNLVDIQAAVGKDLLREVEPKVWQLNAIVYLRSGVSLKLNKNEVTWLKLKSDKNGFVYLRALSSFIEINGVKITSWDQTKNDYDKDMTDGRSYILVKDSSRMDIYNSELAYLGFPRALDLDTSPYGVSWRMSNGKLGSDLLTGEVLDTKFHHNYFGAYTFGATGMTWRGNEFYANTRYGLDPHDDSNGFLVENNSAHDNGAHGIIFSKRCLYNIIQNNHSFNNKLHGLMLHQDSNFNIVRNNLFENNHDGIALWRSSNNLFEKNTIKNNIDGIRASHLSNNNLLRKNHVTQSKRNGFYFYDLSDSNWVSHNNIKNNLYGVYVKTKYNTLNENVIEKNLIGIYLLETADKNFVVKNDLHLNNKFGIYSKLSKQTSVNVLTNNDMWRNRRDLAAQ